MGKGGRNKIDRCACVLDTAKSIRVLARLTLNLPTSQFHTPAYQRTHAPQPEARTRAGEGARTTMRVAMMSPIAESRTCAAEAWGALMIMTSHLRGGTPSLPHEWLARDGNGRRLQVQTRGPKRTVAEMKSECVVTVLVLPPARRRNSICGFATKRETEWCKLEQLVNAV